MARTHHGVYEGLRRNLGLNVWNGVAALISINLVQPFLGIYAIRVGATEQQVGLLSSLPALVSLLVVLPGAAWLQRAHNLQSVTARMILATRFLFAALAIVPLFRNDVRPEVLLFLVALTNLPATLANVGWQSFIGSVIPDAWRADAFAVRNVWTTVAGLVAVMAGGWFMDWAAVPTGYQIAFVIAFLFGIWEVVVFTRIRGPVEAKPSLASEGNRIQSVRAEWVRITADKPLFAFILASFYFHFVWMAAWPVFTVYKVQTLGANNLWMSMCTVTASVGAVLTFRPWSLLSKRKGNGVGLVFAAIGMAAIPMIWQFVKSIQVGAAVDLYGGAVNAGITLYMFNRLLEVATEQHRTKDLAYFHFAVQAAAVIAPMVGIALYQRFGYHITLACIAFLRLTAAAGYAWAARMRSGIPKDPASSTVGATSPAASPR